MNTAPHKKTAPRNGKKSTPSAAFWLGVLLVIAGILGLLWQFLPQKTTTLDSVFPAKTAVFAELELSGDFFKQFKTLSGSEFQMVAKESLEHWIPNGNFDQLDRWIGNRAGIALLPEGEILVATRYQSRHRAEEFLQQFLVSGESFAREEIEEPIKAEILTPAYSSTVAFAFYRQWLIFSTNHETLSAALRTPEKLQDNPLFQKVQKDFSPGANAVVFFQAKESVERFFSEESFSAQLPVLRAVANAIPAGGTTLQWKESRLVLQSKFLTEEGVFSADTAAKQPEKIIPQLSQFAPKDGLLFLNGSDLYEKYRHTREFLSDFHPQFAIIFDGILRNQSREIFGEKFDFEKDFLAKMHGQYSLVLNFADPAEPFVHLTLITGYGGPDREKNLAELTDVIHFAQSQFATEVREVPLPDGSVREELVAKDPREIPIKKEILGGQEYYAAENVANHKKFSYGFFDGYLIFSTHEQGIRDAYTARQTPSASLAQNADFRESVLFDFSAANSYGFVHLGKVLNLIEFSEQLRLTPPQDLGGTSLGKTLLRGFRNATFARKTLPGQVLWTTILRMR